MAVRERREKYILPMLQELGMEEDIVYYDIARPKAERNAMQNAKRTWLASSEKTHVCVMQDDLHLCKGFTEIVNECADRFPDAIFSFYQPRLRWEDANNGTPYIEIVGGGMYGQCIMMPTEMVEPCFRWGDINYGKDYPHDDTVIGFFATVNGIKVMATIPSLVQHLGNSDSALGYNNKNKVSKVFLEAPDIVWFKTNSFSKSKRIPNTEIPPKGGYKCGRLLRLTEIL